MFQECQGFFVVAAAIIVVFIIIFIINNVCNALRDWRGRVRIGNKSKKY